MVVIEEKMVDAKKNTAFVLTISMAMAMPWCHATRSGGYPGQC
jgi:hypothetical protein